MQHVRAAKGKERETPPETPSPTNGQSSATSSHKPSPSPPSNRTDDRAKSPSPPAVVVVVAPSNGNSIHQHGETPPASESDPNKQLRSGSTPANINPPSRPPLVRQSSLPFEEMPTTHPRSPTPPPVPPSALLPLLQCPMCSPPDTLDTPTTLLCGHTICSEHVKSSTAPSSPQISARRPPPRHHSTHPLPLVLPPCPLISCTATNRPRQLNVPIASGVAYYPPIPSLTPGAPSPPTHQGKAPKVKDPRVDVTVSKIVNLVLRATSPSPSPSPISDSEIPKWEETDGEETDEEVARPQELFHNNSGETTAASESDAPPLASHPHGPGPPAPAMNRRHTRPDPSTRPPPMKRSRHQLQRVNTDEPKRKGSEKRFEKELMAELTCEICFMLLYEPVTTPCQHTFCAKCLQRSLDHSVKCPICRQDLPGFSYFQDHALNKVILAIILKAFPHAYAERGRIVEQEERDARLDTPIFVCQLAFPGMPTLLHFFEPRYRLMLRRCLENPRPSFGMVLPPRSSGNNEGNDFGTMLEIRSVQMLPDGRSMVETWGTFRFRILERGNLDGYMVGRVERIDDFPPELEQEVERNALALVPQRQRAPSPQPPPQAPSISLMASLSTTPPMTASQPAQPSPPTPAYPIEPTNEELMQMCHSFLEQLRNGTAPWVVQRLDHTYGPMPTDPSDFGFWMALVLPIDEYEKAKLLPIRSARLRLRLVVHWIEQLNNNWWFSSGCIIS